MFEALIGEKILEFHKKNGTYTQGGKAIDATLEQVSAHHWRATSAGTTQEVFIHHIDRAKGEVTLSINGKKTTIHIRSRMERLLKELGMEGALTPKIDSLNAPMPGLIHSLHVAEGDEVKQGDSVLILEAMKMENVIKSPTDGTIAKILVQQGASVEKGEVMLKYA